jgi:hypothetical protein
MASIDTLLNKLRRLASKNDVEVEHLMKFAVLGDISAVPVIRELQAKHYWYETDRNDVVNCAYLAPWVEVICLYLEGGCDALVSYARKKQEKSFYFAVAVLEELKSTASILAVAELCSDVANELPISIEDAVKLARAINFTLSFKNPPKIYAHTIIQLRNFLHALLSQNLNQATRATIVCALRGVGDEESIRLINELPKFSEPWLGLELLACKAIRKRLKNK